MACASATALSWLGATQTCLTHAGLNRCFYTYVPSSAASSSSLIPVLFDVHGYNTCATLLPYYTRWRQIAAREGFIVIWPMGTEDLAGQSNNVPSWKCDAGIAGI